MIKTKRKKRRGKKKKLEHTPSWGSTFSLKGTPKLEGNYRTRNLANSFLPVCWPQQMFCCRKFLRCITQCMFGFKKYKILTLKNYLADEFFGMKTKHFRSLVVKYKSELNLWLPPPLPERVFSFLFLKNSEERSIRRELMLYVRNKKL